MFEKYIILLTKFFNKLGFSEFIAQQISELVSFVTLLLVTFIIYHLVRIIVEKTVHTLIKKSPSKRDDILIKNKVFRRLCLIIPAYIIRLNIPDALPSYPLFATAIIEITKIYEVFV